MLKLYTINTITNFSEIIFEPFGRPFAQANPDVEIYNIVDDSLLKDTTASGGMTPTIAKRILNYAISAEQSGANGIIVTCTSINEATQYARRFLNIPMIGIEEPAAEQAVLSGNTLGVLATLPTSPAAICRTIDRYAEMHKKTIKKTISIVDGAFDVLCTGNRALHDEMVNSALIKLSKEVDVIVFAQISMSLLKHEPLDMPICKIGNSGFKKIKELMLGNN